MSPRPFTPIPKWERGNSAVSDSRHTDVAVIGGGISGLCTAYYLTQAGLDVRLLEKNDRVGGTIETRRVGKYLIESGPNSALETTPLLGELFSLTGVSPSVRYASAAARNRYIVRDGRLLALPTSPANFIRTPLFSGRAKFGLLKEPFAQRGDVEHDETVAAFVERRLGREFLDYAINPFVAGVYAGSPEKLSLRSSFPKLHELEQRHGSLIKGTIKGARERRRRKAGGETSRAAARMFSFSGGMQTIVDTLAETLSERVITGAALLSVEQRGEGYAIQASSQDGEWEMLCDDIVFAIPAYAFGDITFAGDNSLVAALSRIEYPPVSVAFVGYDTWPTNTPLDGFGFLVPEREQRQILGAIWNSTLFPDRAPDGGACLTTFVGGSRQPQNARLDDRALTDIVLHDLKELMNLSQTPDVVEVRRWPRAIPQYNVGHSRIVAAIEDFEAQHPGLYISGNFRSGVSVSDCVRQAHAISERVVGRAGAVLSPLRV